MKKVLVTGGAGYIGAHLVKSLCEDGREVIVIDNLSQGHREHVHSKAKLYEGDLGDVNFLEKVFSENEIETVVHFAASSLVGESVSDPLKYYQNNVVGMVNLLSAMKKNNVLKIVFSSTAAVYGEPEKVPISEDYALKPTNPYGSTKVTMEEMIRWCDKAYGMKFVALRYFNVAGADGEIGEKHDPETHLIPLILDVAKGKREKILVFGDDYETPDGTCIRDYIHVKDLVDAHILAINKLDDGCDSASYNLGNGDGFSVKEVIEAAREVTGKKITDEIVDRRGGDPAVLVASSENAKKELGWTPKNADIKIIIESAWEWHKKI